MSGGTVVKHEEKLIDICDTELTEILLLDEETNVAYDMLKVAMT